MALNLNLDVKVTPAGLVPNIIRDRKGRIGIAYGRIRGDMKVQGTSVNSKMKTLLQNDRLPSDDIGHIIPKIWGGSGLHLDNLFPQNSMNNRASAWVEKDLAKILAKDENGYITFCINFTYDDSASSSDDDDDDKRVKRRPISYEATTQWHTSNESSKYSYKDKNWTYSIPAKSEPPARRNVSSVPIQRRTSYQSSKNSSKDKNWTNDVSTAAKVAGSAAKAGSTGLKGAAPALRGVSSVAIPVAATIDVVNIYKAAKTGDPEKVVETAVEAGAGWGGAYGGATAGAAVGTALGPAGTIAGGAIGAIAGSIAASKVAKTFFKW